MNDNAVMINHQEATDLLGISDRTFYRLVKKGFIEKVVQPGMTYGKYRREDVMNIKKVTKENDSGSETRARKFLERYLRAEAAANE